MCEVDSLRIAIVDDAKSDRDELKTNLMRYFEEMKLNCISAPDQYVSSEVFLQSGHCLSYDIVFFDIYMDGMSGMEAAKTLREQSDAVKIVFTTTSKEFAVESYEVFASYYLVKKYRYETFSKMMDVMISQIEIDMRELHLPNGKSVRLRELVYIDCFHHFLYLHFRNNESIRFRINYTDIVTQLAEADDFVECYKGTLVNLREVSGIKSSSFLMKNGVEILISRRKLREMRARFDDLLFNKVRGY